MSKKIEKKIDEITKKIESEPYNADYYYSRGCAYGWIGERQKCHDDYSKAFQLEPDNMIYLTNFAIMAKEITVHIGQALIPVVENARADKVIDEKFKNLRKTLKNAINGSDVYVPPVGIKDSQHIKPYEIALYIDGAVILKKEFPADSKGEINGDNIFDDIIEIIKKIFSREYLKTA